MENFEKPAKTPDQEAAHKEFWSALEMNLEKIPADKAAEVRAAAESFDAFSQDPVSDAQLLIKAMTGMDVSNIMDKELQKLSEKRIKEEADRKQAEVDAAMRALNAE